MNKDTWNVGPTVPTALADQQGDRELLKREKMARVLREIQICDNGKRLVEKVILNGHKREDFIGKHHLSLSYIDAWSRRKGILGGSDSTR